MKRVAVKKSFFSSENAQNAPTCVTLQLFPVIWWIYILPIDLFASKSELQIWNILVLYCGGNVWMTSYQNIFRSSRQQCSNDVLQQHWLSNTLRNQGFLLSHATHDTHTKKTLTQCFLTSETTFKFRQLLSQGSNDDIIVSGFLHQFFNFLKQNQVTVTLTPVVAAHILNKV